MSTPPPPPSGSSDDPYGTNDQSGPGDAQSGYGSGDSYGSGSGGYQGAPGYYGGSPSGDQDNNLGVIALVTGIISLVICTPLGIVPIIYGRKSQAAAAAGTANNGTLGTVGFWLGVVALILLALAIILIAVGAISIGVLTGGTTTSP